MPETHIMQQARGRVDTAARQSIFEADA
jgi:hypothetical protein